MGFVGEQPEGLVGQRERLVRFLVAQRLAPIIIGIVRGLQPHRLRHRGFEAVGTHHASRRQPGRGLSIRVYAIP